jgi:hypothetical protein
MTVAAVSDRGEFAATPDEIGIERLRRRPIDRSDRWPPNDGKGCPYAAKQERNEDTSDYSRLCHTSRQLLAVFPLQIRGQALPPGPTTAC